MRPEDLRPLSLFRGTSDERLADLIEAGSEEKIEPGVDLFREGDPADCWWVVVSGSIDLLRHLGREDTVVGRMTAGRWAGGFRAWDERGVYLATGRGHEPGQVLRVPASVLRRLTDEWFPLGGHIVEGVFGTARHIESTARQRDALATLGTLAAGLAHEINNPAAAASRAVTALEACCGTLLDALSRLARKDVTAPQFSAIDDLRREIRDNDSARDPLTLADQEDALAAWLVDHGVEHDDAIAPALTAGGVTVEWCERAADVLGGTALEPGLEWVASSLSAQSLLSEMKESTRRISELVASVRSYTQMDRASMQLMDITEGLDSTLVMLGHKLRGGVSVLRAFASDVPRIEANAGELNQVWTNLIDNAIDAMGGSGTLQLRTCAEDDQVVVEIEDSGHGMPPEVAARAFDAFYTTKAVGEGTGLGLDIARRIIVERHGGAITIDSDPGRTVVRVSLPSHQPPS